MSPTEITPQQLFRLIGTPDAPSIIDVRSSEHFDADSRIIPGAIRRHPASLESWAPRYQGRHVVVVCEHGKSASQGVAAWLRQLGIEAESLDGGMEAWRAAGALLVTTAKLPARDSEQRTVWVTRARPKVDRIACPWLIRRFVDPDAVFLFVAPTEVAGVAERFKATPFDVEGVFWSHREGRCTFDTMIEELGLDSEPLAHLAKIVRAADTADMSLAPEAAGLLAASLGYSRMYRDDLEQLGHAMALYDAVYRWCRDATEETHNWPAASPRTARARTSDPQPA